MQIDSAVSLVFIAKMQCNINIIYFSNWVPQVFSFLFYFVNWSLGRLTDYRRFKSDRLPIASNSHCRELVKDRELKGETETRKIFAKHIAYFPKWQPDSCTCLYCTLCTHVPSGKWAQFTCANHLQDLHASIVACASARNNMWKMNYPIFAFVGRDHSMQTHKHTHRFISTQSAVDIRENAQRTKTTTLILKSIKIVCTYESEGERGRVWETTSDRLHIAHAAKSNRRQLLYMQ